MIYSLNNIHPFLLYPGYPDRTTTRLLLRGRLSGWYEFGAMEGKTHPHWCWSKGYRPSGAGFLEQRVGRIQF